MRDLSSDLVRIAKRENNRKRNYLVVNRLQGKHIPAKPAEALSMFRALAERMPQSYAGTRTLVIGFAETATAIGAALAAALGSYYIQTTRENVPEAEYLYFSEEHSHAAQQRLVKNDLDLILPRIDRIVFAEDEITTGKTILHLVDQLQKDYRWQGIYTAVSILNGMDTQAMEHYQARNIRLFYLAKTQRENYESMLAGYVRTGTYVDARNAALLHTALGESVPGGPRSFNERPAAREMEASGWMDARRLVCSDVYEQACLRLWEQVRERTGVLSDGRMLVLGTEEFMYPALLCAAHMAENGADVRFHATTRSPIEVYEEEQYPLHVRYELPSVYDKNRRTFVYDLDRYDRVLIFTDAHNTEREGVDALVRAVSLQNENIDIVRWC